MADGPEGKRPGRKAGTLMNPAGPPGTSPPTAASTADDLIARMADPDIAMTEAIEAINAAEDPLAFFLAVMKAPAIPFPYRFEAAKQAAPFCHAKPIAKQGKPSANQDAAEKPGDIGAFEAVLARRRLAA